MGKLSTAYIQKMYDTEVDRRFQGNYEHYRWFARRLDWERYLTTWEAIHDHVPKGFASCFELGPGSGIWTRQLIAISPDAEFVLLDISESMLGQTRMNLGERKNMKLVHSDFLEYKPKRTFDLVFSSRAIEYIPDMEAVFERFGALMNDKGSGCVVTKMPHPMRQRLRRGPVQHTGQVSPATVRAIASSLGLRARFYPATVSVPFVRMHWLNRLLFRILRGRELQRIWHPFLESYLITLHKDDHRAVRTSRKR